jgi:CheY-like chemotaxis protein
MSIRNVKLLHAEDDAMQQRLIGHHLQALPEYVFTITTAATEQLAMDSFQETPFDLVLVDYQLAHGDGLQVLSRIRAIDWIIPIIAISGIATSDVAAQLVRAGADDYFDKRYLTSADLAKSIRSSLRRANAVRKKVATRTTDTLSRFTNQLTELCADYVRRMGGGFLEQLDVIAQDLKDARISAYDLEAMYENATSRLEVAGGADQGRIKRLARPLLFDLIIRLNDGANVSSGQSPP